MLHRLMVFVSGRSPLLKRVYHRLGLGARRYDYLFDIIRHQRCRRIMEIGTLDGEHALQMIREAKRSRLKEVVYYGFDLFEEMDDVTFEAEISKRPPRLADVQRKLEATGCQVRLFQGNTKKTLPESVAELPKMDLIFIDGGHSVETIQNDWKYAQRLMSKDTIVIFDDYWNRDDAGAKPVVEKIDRKKYRVEVLPIQDRFKKHDGILLINFVKVRRI